MVLTEILLAIALLAIIIIGLGAWLFPKPPIVTGQIPAPLGNPVPSGVTGVTGAWVQTFPNLETGVTYHFIYKLTGSSGTTTSALANINISFAAGPSSHVIIESVNGYSGNNSGNTMVATSISGTVDVHLKAVSEPSDFQGAIVAIPHGSPLSSANTQFEIHKP